MHKEPKVLLRSHRLLIASRRIKQSEDHGSMYCSICTCLGHDKSNGPDQVGLPARPATQDHSKSPPPARQRERAVPAVFPPPPRRLLLLVPHHFVFFEFVFMDALTCCREMFKRMTTSFHQKTFQHTYRSLEHENYHNNESTTQLQFRRQKRSTTKEKD